MSERDKFALVSIALRYLEALEKDDQEVLSDLWQQAEADPELEQLLLELNEGRSSALPDVDWHALTERCQPALREIFSSRPKSLVPSEIVEVNGQAPSPRPAPPCCPKPAGALRILHTGDWHLGDRLGSRGIDRGSDLRRAVEQIAAYCRQYEVDVLLVVGDLFSDKAGVQSNLSDTIQHLAKTFQSFLVGGGTILALTGNHDKDAPCQTLRSTLHLASPEPTSPGGSAKSGRLYLATGPTFFRLGSSNGTEIQFILMPYPTPPRYFDGSGKSGVSRSERNRVLQVAYTDRLQRIRSDPSFRQDLPSVLAAHIHIKGAAKSGEDLFRITENEDVIVPDADVPTELAYVALGHIHRPQSLGGLSHVRYCGSIECLKLGDDAREKSVVLVDIGPEGRLGDPTELPLEATPIYEVVIDNPREQLPRLRQQYPDAERALVRCKVIWRAGEDNREEIQRQLEAIFPRCYDWDVSEAGTAMAAGGSFNPPASASYQETILSYLKQKLEADPDRDDLLKLTESLLEECA